MRKKFLLAISIILIISLPLAISAATKYKTLNITKYIYNRKGRFKIKDLLTVTKNAVFSKDIKVKGDINVEDDSVIDGVNLSDLKLTVDNLSVGQVSLDIASTSGLILTGNSLSLLDTCTDNQILKFNQTDSAWECATDIATVSGSDMTIGNGLSLDDDNTLSVSGVTSDMINDSAIEAEDLASNSCSSGQMLKYSGTSWACADDVDTDTNTTYTAGDNITIASGVISATDTNTTYTAGTGITLNSTAFSADLGTSISAAEIDADAVGAAALASTAIQSGDIEAADLPTISSDNLSDVASLAMLDEAETIAGNWVNTTNPWQNNEVADDITASSYLPLAGGIMTGDLDIGGSNIKYLSTTDFIDTAIASAAAGDTLILAAGTYTITEDIDITKSISIIGQGKNITTITTTTDSIKVFEITASNVNIQNLSIDVTASATVGIYVNGTGGNVLSDVNVNNIDVTLNSHAGAQNAVYYEDAGGEVRDVTISVASSDASGGAGVHQGNQSSAEANTTLKCYNTNISATTVLGAATAFDVIESNDSFDAIIYVYNSNGTATSYGVSTTGSDTAVYAENSVFSGSNYDVNNPTGTMQLKNVTLVNGTTYGTITLTGYSSFMKSVDSDPCTADSGLPVGSFFYNSTAGVPCYCSNSNVDKKVADDTNCF